MIRGPRLASDQLPAAPSATDLSNVSRSRPALIAIEQALAHADHAAGDQHLIGHLGVLVLRWPALDGSMVGLAHGVPAGLAERHTDLSFAADHDRKASFLGFRECRRQTPGALDGVNAPLVSACRRFQRPA